MTYTSTGSARRPETSSEPAGPRGNSATAAVLGRLRVLWRDLQLTSPARSAASQLSTYRPVVAEIPTPTPADPAVTELVARLCAGGVEEAVAREIATSIPPRRRRGLTYTSLVTMLADRFATLARAEQPAPIEIFVGPPGVGKTSTIVKLAARARAQHGVRVGLISADGYRVGAIEQLRLYAGVIGAPFTAARSVDELHLAVADRQQPLLIDTAGRDPQDQPSRELFHWLSRRSDVRTHLVVDGYHSAAQLARVWTEYLDARPDRLVLTKLDRIPSVGPLLGVIRDIGCPVSYLCTGQQIPEDIEAASPQLLAASVLGDTSQPDADAA